MIGGGPLKNPPTAPLFASPEVTLVKVVSVVLDGQTAATVYYSTIVHGKRICHKLLHQGCTRLLDVPRTPR